MKPRVTFLVNGPADSPADVRARQFATRLRGQFDATIVCRHPNRQVAIFVFVKALMGARPQACYVMDLAYSGLIAARIYYLLTGCPVVLDTGDAITELARLSGSRGAAGLWLTRQLELAAYRWSQQIVVRSGRHRELLRRRHLPAESIPDGVETARFSSERRVSGRSALGLDGWTTVGVLGSLVWNERWQMCYGWELIEALQYLTDLQVKGIIIGDGSGLSHLQDAAVRYGVQDRVLFLGRRRYDDLPELLRLCDVCLSTQTNDAAGEVRTTGKLPLYLASGRFVLATRVGEAAAVLGDEMLLDYAGTKDATYPLRLSQRIRALLTSEQIPSVPNGDAVALARKHFDYDVLAPRVISVIKQAIDRPDSKATALSRPTPR